MYEPYRQINDPVTRRLIILKVHNGGLIVAPAIAYQRHADCASLDEAACPQLKDMLQIATLAFPSSVSGGNSQVALAGDSGVLLAFFGAAEFYHRSQLGAALQHPRSAFLVNEGYYLSETYCV